MDAKMTGELIARKRKELGLSQAELAGRVHVTDKAISRWETGRGMPGVDSLEPLADVLGLTVSELLSGRELTAEERPREAEVQIVDSLRKNRRMLWRGVLITLLTLVTWVILVLGIWLGRHYFNSVPAENAQQLAQAAERYWNDQGLQVIQTQKRGDYIAALLRRDDGHMRLCVYERDSVFKNRWYGGGGKSNVKPGELASWNFGSPQSGAVIVICGSDLPEEAVCYIFENNGTTYLRPVDETVLDVFVIPDGGSDINGTPILLNRDLKTVDRYSQDWVDGMLNFE